jgi:hypothetical protein
MSVQPMSGFTPKSGHERTNGSVRFHFLGGTLSEKAEYPSARRNTVAVEIYQLPRGLLWPACNVRRFC